MLSLAGVLVLMGWLGWLLGGGGGCCCVLFGFFVFSGASSSVVVPQKLSGALTSATTNSVDLGFMSLGSFHRYPPPDLTIEIIMNGGS